MGAHGLDTKEMHIHLEDMRTGNSYKFDTTYTVLPIVARLMPHPSEEDGRGVSMNVESQVVVLASSAEDIVVSV